MKKVQTAEQGLDTLGKVWWHFSDYSCVSVLLFKLFGIFVLQRCLSILSLYLFQIGWYVTLAHQNRTIAIASDFRVDGAKSPEILQKEGVSASEIAARNRKSLATFLRTLKSQCKVSEIASDFWGPRWASQSQIAKVAAISVR